MNKAEPALEGRYASAVEIVGQLRRYDRYEGAFVFGSFATEKLHEGSDLDIVVLLADGQPSCVEVSHPLLGDIRVDISFNSMATLIAMTDESLREGLRKPWLYDAHILFDKQGRLQQLKDRILCEARPARRDPTNRSAIQFDVYYLYTKPGKYMASDPTTASLVMHMGLRKLLDLHYKLNGRWWVSDKQMLADLAGWDPTLHLLLMQFLTVSDLGQKYIVWKEMIDHVLKPVDGRDFRRMEGSCECARCQTDIQRLLELTA
jgi:hypothetical protein